jgi:hypothetical protein
MIMGHDAPHPLPAPVCRIQPRGIGRLSLQAQPALGTLHDGVDCRPVTLASSIVHHQPPLLGRAAQQLPQEGRALPTAQRQAEVLVGPSGQRGPRARDADLGMVSPRGHVGHLIGRAPRGGQGGVAAPGCLVYKEPGRIGGPVFPPGVQLRHTRDLLLGLRPQRPMAPPPQAKTRLMGQRPHPFPAVPDANAGVDAMAHQLCRPDIHVIPQLPGAATHRLFDLCAWPRGESTRPPRNRHSLQAWQPRSVKGVPPGTHGPLASIQPWRTLRTVLAIHPQQKTVAPLAQPYIGGTATGSPDLLSGNAPVRDGPHIQAPLERSHAYITRA